MHGATMKIGDCIHQRLSPLSLCKGEGCWCHLQKQVYFCILLSAMLQILDSNTVCNASSKDILTE